ncbi:hypothetical protein ACS0TY_031992 [Phlomoides rotata]
MIISSLPNRALSILFPYKIQISQKFPKTLALISKMSSWACSKCTFINPPSQKSRCEICLSTQPQPLVLSSSLKSSPSNPKWSCASCTFLNPYCSTICEICGTRASASLRSTLEIDDDDVDEAQLGSAVGSVFLPLRGCSTSKKENSRGGGDDTDSSGELKSALSSLPRRVNASLGIKESQSEGNGGNGKSDSGEKKSLFTVLRPCSNKRKDREEGCVNGDRSNVGSSSGFRTVKSLNDSVEAKPLGVGETHSSPESKMWKFLSYNVWFREDLEMHNRMLALGNLIQMHSPDVICLQEVTPTSYEIFQQSGWWKGYRCSIANQGDFTAGYFCIQLSKLPVKSYSSRPFHNSIMGRELCVAEVEIQPDTIIVVATSHLESPCPGPPTWDQMLSKERVVQANEAVKFLEKNQNAIFCGDMNWDDKLDGPFPLLDGWIDAWTELRPGEVGWTYDTRSNKMLSGNRALQKRLDRFICKLKDFKIGRIEMIGRDAIPGLSYVKEKKVRGQVKEMELPVLPSDHYGLLLTIYPSDST